MGENMQVFQTPRVNGAVLAQFVGRTVCVVGKVVSQDEGAGGEGQLKTSDNTVITVQMSPGNSWTTQYVEVIGHLHNEFTLQEFKSADFENDFDLDMYNKAVELMTGKFSYLFYSAQD